MLVADQALAVPLLSAPCLCAANAPRSEVPQFSAMLGGTKISTRRVSVMQTKALDYRALFETTPTPFLILTPPDFRITAVKDAYLRATLTEREAIPGRLLFEGFPDDPPIRLQRAPPVSGPAISFVAARLD